MKKYKVVTDNLDWYGLIKNDIIRVELLVYNETSESCIDMPYEVVKSRAIKDAIVCKPEWFEEVNEEKRSDWSVREILLSKGGKEDIEIFVILKNLTEDEVKLYVNENDRAIDYCPNYKEGKMEYVEVGKKYFTKEDVIEFAFSSYNKLYKYLDRGEPLEPVGIFKKRIFEEWLKSNETNRDKK